MVPRMSLRQPESMTSMAPDPGTQRDVTATRMVPRMSARQPESMTPMAPDTRRKRQRRSHADGPEDILETTGEHDLDGIRQTP
jgi:hypothetical protein